MSRSSRALSISCVLHAALVASLLGVDSKPWVADDTRPIRVRLQQPRDVAPEGARRADVAEEGARAGPAPADDARAREADTRERVTSATRTRARVAPPTIDRPTRPPRPALPELELPEPEPQARMPGSLSAARVELTAARVTRIEPVPLRPAIATAQRRMLADRTAEWARDLERLAEPAAWSENGRDYTARVTHTPASDGMALDEAVVTVSTIEGGHRLSTEIRMKRLAFSSFAQFIDRWDRGVQIHDDVIDGRFHSNSEIVVSRSGGVQPAFHGPVTTAQGVDTSHSERRVDRDDVFLGGLETRAGRIAMPRRFAPFADAAHVDADRVQRFARDTRIAFHADGTYTWYELGTAGPARRRTLGDAPRYLVGTDDAELYVSGVVDGRVLVYSPERIVIEGGLVYAAHPESTTGSDDYVGLVADGTVEIAEPDVTGPGDLHVHAAIYAKRRFAISRYRRREHATLHIFGSITAGSLTATEPRYRTHVRFDTRLENARPPRFPMTDRYEVSDWDGRWTVQPLSTAASDTDSDESAMERETQR